MDLLAKYSASEVDLKVLTCRIVRSCWGSSWQRAAITFRVLSENCMESNVITTANRMGPRGSKSPPASKNRSVVQLLNEPQPLRFSQPPDLRRPIMHGLLRAGETLSLVGPPGIGKTWLAIDLALSVATGQNWLQTFVMGAGPVLYINSDLHRETIVDRIRQVADARDIFRCTLHERLCVEALRGRTREEFQLETYLRGWNRTSSN